MITKATVVRVLEAITIAGVNKAIADRLDTYKHRHGSRIDALESRITTLEHNVADMRKSPAHARRKDGPR